MKLFSERVVLPAGTIEPALIEVDGPLISGVIPLNRADLTHPPDVDLGARLLAPAFTNTHTHLCLSALRGLVGRDALSRVVAGRSNRTRSPIRQPLARA